MPQGWTSDISKGVIANIIYLNDYSLTRMTIMNIVMIRKWGIYYDVCGERDC